jgi:hypothetical protein
MGLPTFFLANKVCHREIPRLKAEFPTVEQPWYADNSGASGKLIEICHFFLKLEEIGPSFGYLPEPSKSILVVCKHNFEALKTAFSDLGFKGTKGSPYLGARLYR